MKFRKYYVFALLPYVLFFVLGSFFDLEVEQALYIGHQNNPYGLIFFTLGGTLGYSILAYFCGYFLNSAIKEKNMIFKIVLLIVSIGGFGLLVYLSSGDYISANSFAYSSFVDGFRIIGIVACLSIFGMFAFLGFMRSKSVNDQTYTIKAFILAIALIIAMVPVLQGLKNLMRRPRFRTIGVIDEVSFVNWWQSNVEQYKSLIVSYGKEISEDFKSFPSGHAALGACLIFGLPYLCELNPKIKGKETMMFVFGFIFAMVIAISRITMGAHYLSDIGVGGLLVILFSILANEINIIIVKKKEA